MHHFETKNGEVYAEGVPLSAIAEAVGTPCYVYSSATLRRHLRVFREALDGIEHLVCYSVKANSNLSVLQLLKQQGAGFDIVSGGELKRVDAIGGDPAMVVFSGVGKTRAEMQAALLAGILSFHVESQEELDVLAAVAQSMDLVAPVSVRVNPDVDPETHPYISTGLRKNKFGVPPEQAMMMYRKAARSRHLRVEGIACHIGSQLVDTAPFVEALARLLDMIDQLGDEGIHVQSVDLGGGLGIPYGDEIPPTPRQYAEALRRGLGERRLRLILEPGRVIAGNAGVLLTRVLYRKKHHDKQFVVVDAAMNDAIRPALYGAQHGFKTVRETPGEPVFLDIVGPVCETGDFLARDYPLVLPGPGDLLAMMSVGAYGFSMSSQYNSRPRAAEVLVDGDQWRVVRPREDVDDMIATELSALESQDSQHQR